MATDNRELRYPTGVADLSDLDIYANGLPHAAFRALREQAPVFWNPEENGPGYWAITRYQDVVAISKKPQLYSNALGGHYISYESMGINDPEAQNAFLHMLLAMDPPEHNLHRRLIAPAFNPSIVKNFEAGVRRKVGNCSTELRIAVNVISSPRLQPRCRYGRCRSCWGTSGSR